MSGWTIPGFEMMEKLGEGGMAAVWKARQVSLDRMVEEVQQVMMKQYVLTDVARMLCDELEDYSIIARRNDHFLALLPEVTPEELANLADRLRQGVSEQVGVTLQIGTASFPEEALTFESLVERAIEEMHGEQELECPAPSQRLVREHHPM